MSDDGSLTIDVPAGANASGVAIAAQRIEPGLSPELDPFTTSWELGPDGTRFAEPVTVTVTLDDRWDGAVPVMLVALESADGAELVADVAAEVVAGAATFTFEIDHFSRLYLFDGSIRMSLFPSRHSGPENSPFDATLSVGAADAGVDDSFLARSIDWGADGSGVVLRSDSALSVRAEVQGFTCTTGTGRYWVDLTVSDAYADHDEVSTGSVWAEFLGLDPDVVLDGTSHRGLLYGDADCTGSGCRLEPSDPSRPSIGRTGAAAVEALPELTAGAESRDIGLGLLTDVDGGALCLEDVVSLVSDGLVTDPVRSAVETLTE